MKYVPASELAERLTSVMSTVEAGEEVTVTGDGGKALARIVPAEGKRPIPDAPTPEQMEARRRWLKDVAEHPLIPAGVPVRWTRDELYEDDPE